MNGLLLGLAVLVSSTQPPAAPKPPGVAIASAAFRFELLQAAASDLPGRVEWKSSGMGPERPLVRPAQAARPKRSKVSRIVAIAARASIGWVAGGAIGYAVTPKRGPHDDTSGLKGVLIGAPIGGAAGALIAWQLTK